MREPGERIAAIDVAKGCCLLWVLLIHAEALRGTRVMQYVFNHAVPLFVVLFGLNAELWWRRGGSLAEWYRSRAERILVPMYAALAVWWALALALPHPPVPPPFWDLLPRHILGYLHHVGTGWFITLVIQLVLVFPLLHALARRWGMWCVLLAGLACLVAGVATQPSLWLSWGSFAAAVFAPRFLGHVAFGMALAPRVERLGVRAALVSAAAVGAAVLVQERMTAFAPYAERLMDLPLAVLLLASARAGARVGPVREPLAWIGRRSYGLYLGQLLTHNAAVFALGLYRLERLLSRPGVPAVYALVLLGGALGFVALGEGVLATARALRGREAATSAREPPRPPARSAPASPPRSAPR